MPPVLETIIAQVRWTTLIDIGITALLIYWLFSLVRGTRAVRLIIGVSVLLGVYAAAQVFELRVLAWLLETGAVVGLFALVVVFQPELRRALDRIGRVGSFAWLLSAAETRAVGQVADAVAKAASSLSVDGHGALIVLERETGLEEVAETGVMIHGDVTADLLRTIFAPRTPLHDGAVIIRGETLLAAGALLPLAETTLHTERFGTRHRAALGITEQTDAVVVVVSEENGQISLVERARIVRNLNETQLARTLRTLLDRTRGRRRGPLGRFLERSTPSADGPGGRAPRLSELRSRSTLSRSIAGRRLPSLRGAPAAIVPADRQSPERPAIARASTDRPAAKGQAVERPVIERSIVDDEGAAAAARAQR
jgi:diadenylate cyclase